jgi:hypothetical protein
VTRLEALFRLGLEWSDVVAMRAELLAAIHSANRDLLSTFSKGA